MRKRTVVLAVLTSVVVAAIVYGLVLIRHGFSARDNPSRLEALLATRMRRWAMPAGAREQKNPVANSPAVLQEALEHFADHCATCHSNNGSGQTEIGQNLYPKAPDMRLAATQDLSDGEIYYIIHNGIRLSGMPAWGKAEEDLDSWKLVHFIRHLPKLTAEEEQQMERLNPRGPGEMPDEQSVEDFLSGKDKDAKQPPKEHH